MANKTINNKQRLGACNLILHIHVVVNQQLSKQGIADQFHMIASRAQVSTHRGCVNFLKVIPCSFDRRLNSKRISLQRLQVYCLE